MRIWIGVGVFVAVVVLAFALFVLHITGSPRSVPPPPLPTYADITDISVSDSYSSKTGVHSITGSAAVPTPCTKLEATSTIIASANASSSPMIRIDLSAPVDVGTCLQLVSQKPFTLSVHAAKESDITVYANGTLASTTSK